MNNIQKKPDDFPTNGPLVSVGIPTYNHPDGLRTTLIYITRQTYKNLEIIVSDNYSPGHETEKVVREFMENDTRIHFYRQDENRGMTFNFKFVFERATGEYFMWAADDDIWEEKFIHNLLKFLIEHPDTVVAQSQIKVVFENSNFTSIIRFPDFSKPEYNGFKMALFASCHNSISFYMYGLFRRKTLEKFYKNLDNSYGSDLVVICEVLLSSKFGFVDEMLHAKKMHSQAAGERYPEDEVGKSYARPLPYLSMLCNFGPSLFHSKNIPNQRKLWIPFMVSVQGVWIGSIYAYRTFRFLYRSLFRKGNRSQT